MQKSELILQGKNRQGTFLRFETFLNRKQSIRNPVQFICNQNSPRLFAMHLSSVSLTFFVFLVIPKIVGKVQTLNVLVVSVQFFCSEIKEQCY